MFVQVNVFVETLFVKVILLMLISFGVNLFSLFHHINSRAIFYIFPFHLNIFIIFSVITMNIFTNFLLAIVILLTNLICLREFLMFVSRNSTFLRFSLKTYHFSIMPDNVTTDNIRGFFFYHWYMCFCNVNHYCSKFFNI